MLNFDRDDRIPAGIVMNVKNPVFDSNILEFGVMLVIILAETGGLQQTSVGYWHGEPVRSKSVYPGF